MIGAFLGALFLGMLRDGLTIKGISAFTYIMVLGHRHHRLDDPQLGGQPPAHPDEDGTA